MVGSVQFNDTLGREGTSRPTLRDVEKADKAERRQDGRICHGSNNLLRNAGL